MKQEKKLIYSLRYITGYILTGFLLFLVCPLYGQEVVITEASDSIFTAVADTVIISDTPIQAPADSINTESFIPEIIEEEDSIRTEILLPELPETTVQEAYLVADSVFITENAVIQEQAKSTFKPNSTKAVLYSAIFPGLGQIYNRSYWKLPLVYGGWMGFIYAITWNNRMYQDYFQAYKGIIDDYTNRPDATDPKDWHSSWTELVPNREQNYISNTTFHNQLKRRKDYYRRYRDLSIILAVGFYAICMIDAYVDAELFDFDISPDLSMRVEPLIVPRTSVNQWSFGLSYSITF